VEYKTPQGREYGMVYLGKGERAGLRRAPGGLAAGASPGGWAGMGQRKDVCPIFHGAAAFGGERCPAGLRRAGAAGRRSAACGREPWHWVNSPRFSLAILLVGINLVVVSCCWESPRRV